MPLVLLFMSIIILHCRYVDHTASIPTLSFNGLFSFAFLEYLLIIFTYSKRGDFNSCVLFSSLHTHNGTENLRGHIFSQERP